MEPSSIKCHTCTTQHTPSRQYLCFFFCTTIISPHHLSTPVQVIPKQGLSIHDARWWSIFKASLSTTVSTHSLSPSYKASIQSSSPRLKRCLWIFNAAIMLVCVPVNGVHWLGVHTSWKKNGQLALEHWLQLHKRLGCRDGGSVGGGRWEGTSPSTTMRHQGMCRMQTWRTAETEGFSPSWPFVMVISKPVKPLQDSH